MSKEVYRSAASVLLLRPNGDSYQILLLRKPRKRDAWQLPQGGREEGENIEQAALRELMEEAGINNAEVLGKSSAIYQYDFPVSYRRFRPDHVKGQKIEFICALTGADTVVTVDQKEINLFVWVTLDELRRYVKRGEYLHLVQRVYEDAMRFLKQ